MDKFLILKEIRFFIAVVFAIVFLTWSITTAEAKIIIYVDVNNTSGTEDGTPDHPFNTIEEGIVAASNGDTVKVAPGTYNENLVIDGIGITLMGEDPAATMIQGSSSVISVTGAFSPEYKTVEITGFTITGGANSGVYLNSGTVMGKIYNNIIVGNNLGIFAEDSAAHIFNNVIRINSEHGIYSSGSGTFLIVSNNIITQNGSHGIERSSTPTVKSFYNNLWNNVDGNYGSSMDKVGDISANPLFVDLETGNYQLSSLSPCIDAGRPLASDNDPDGSRNDMGVYGGPGSAVFWPTPDSGPVVTDLTVEPSSVDENGTISIRATGKIR